jgi:hypothetical protein
MANQSMQRYRCHKEVWAVKIAEIRRYAIPVFLRPTCRGCFALRSACGHCERCDWELDGGRLNTFIVPADGPPIRVSEEFLAKHKPEAGGYYVVYDDGYVSFSPASAFEAGYTLL